MRFRIIFDFSKFSFDKFVRAFTISKLSKRDLRVMFLSGRISQNEYLSNILKK